MSTTLLDLTNSQKIITTMNQILADTYILYVKTQNFHWNVVDERFYFLHKMFEEQYEALEEATDTIAERIRALNGKALGSLQQFLENSSLSEAENNLTANAMLKALIEDHTLMANRLRPLIPEFQEDKDEGSADLLIEQLRFHEKTAWMLKSHFTGRQA